MRSAGTLRSFLLAQSHGKSVDAVRSDTARRHRESRVAAETAASGYDLDHEVWDLAVASQVKDALDALPVELRQPIELAYFGGNTYREVVELLDAPEGTVKGRIRSGLKESAKESHRSRYQIRRSRAMTSHEPPMSHQEVQELLGAYALDAVDPELAAIIEDHLRHCARCAQEVAEHHEVAGLLANSGGAAPTGLWQSIADRLGETPPSWEQLARGLDVPVDRATSVPVEGSAAVGPPSIESGPSQRRRRTVRSTLALAAAAIVVVAVVLGVQVGDLHHQLDQARSTSLTQAEQAALAAPTTRQIRLTPPSATGEPATTAVTVVLTRSGAGFVVTHELPALPSGKTYQLWAVTGEQKISLGLLGSNPGIAPFSVAGNRPVDAFAITAEHAGGVVQTANTPVVEGVVAR